VDAGARSPITISWIFRSPTHRGNTCPPAEIAELHVLALQPMSGHAPEPRDHAFQSIDLLTPDVDVLGVERGATRQALEAGAKEVQWVTHFVCNFGRNGLDQGLALATPGGGLLPAPRFELAIGVRVSQRQRSLIHDGVQEIDIVV
jgi:hypothetical protein